VLECILIPLGVAHSTDKRKMSMTVPSAEEEEEEEDVYIKLAEAVSMRCEECRWAQGMGTGVACMHSEFIRDVAAEMQIQEM
jgi:hypothetical protein